MANYPQIDLYIDGRWKHADGQPVINPADESVLGTVPTATRADLDDALAAAEKGFAVWRRTSPAKRAQIILKAASLIRERVNEMAVAMTLEQGKPIEQARLEIIRGCDIIEWDATEGLRLYGRVIPSEPGMRHTVLRQPIGPVAAFSPWNFPMSSPARKVAGALSSGCSIILKASEETPAGAVQLVRAFHDAGDDRHGASDLALRRLEHQLVVHLQQHLRGELLLTERLLHAHHRAADDVRRRALDGRIDRGALDERALGRIG